tara:strand:+ start:20 stop:733 length:714 start_codon:yes stop_codon:yes gene_type:complete
MDDVHIILTTSVNITKKYKGDILIKRPLIIKQNKPQERKDCYIKSIMAWLDLTNFNITLVENSGYDWPELKDHKEKYKERFEIISFDIVNDVNAARIFNYRYLSKGLLEMYSIIYAFNHSQLCYKNNPYFIIKITGRYFIPNFDTYLKSIDLKLYKSIRQKKCKLNRCEMVGCRVEIFKDFFDIKLTKQELPHYKYVESIYKIRHEKLVKKNVFTCKPLKLGWKTRRGGANSDYLYL